jgi:hypothetical protein
MQDITYGATNLGLDYAQTLTGRDIFTLPQIYTPQL